jgi:hypothetical protein
MKCNFLLIKKILFIVLGAVLFITSIILFAQSISAYSGSSGSGFDANSDYVVAMILSGIILCVSIYNLVGKQVNEVANYSLLAGSLIGFGYSLGVFIKGLIKGGKFEGLQVYLYFSLAALVLFLIAGAQYFINKSNKENK